ncbi:MAG TPA: phosphomannomutase/phosphoglucomutase, partial [Thermomonas sp.]|nr:phosphomannomutase/phosphoglucomutase [Thermomonas sp.]
MNEGLKGKLRLGRGPAAALAVVLALLGAWLLAAGALRLRDDQRLEGLQAARDQAAADVRRGLQAQLRTLSTRLATPAVRDALASGDPAAAARALAAGWPEARGTEVWPADLGPAYAALPRGGYGRLAAAEAALAAGKPVARVVKAGAAERLALAAPVAGPQGPMVAYVEVPMTALEGAVKAAALPSGAYLALRQGGRSVLERGDAALGQGAESLAVPVPDSELRLAAAVPDPVATPMGLGAVPALVAGLLLLLAAAGAWFGLRGRGRSGASAAADGAAGPAAEPTLAELQRAQPAPAQAAASPPAADAAPRAATPAVAIDRGIFRAYDIRGIVGQTLDAGVAELIGQAIGSLMHEKGLEDIVVGRDGRLSGPDLAQGLIAGLRKAGRNVIDIGMVPTPVVYFGCYHLRTGCGVSITGSHNPPDYNGFKIVVGGETLSGRAVGDLHARIAEDRLHDAAVPGTVSERDIGDDYVERIAGDIQIGRRLKVVVDAGNGVAGALGPRVLEAIGADVTPLFCDIDGT